MRRIFDFALKAFILLSPIFFFRDFQLSLARGMFFVFASFGLFGISLFLRPKRNFRNVWIGLFLLWSLFRVFAGPDPLGDPSQEWFNFWLNSASFIYILAGILLFYTVYCHAGDPKRYLKPVLIVCTLNFVLVMAQLAGHDFMWAHDPGRFFLDHGPSGFIGTSSQLGQYSAMSIPILLCINPLLIALPFVTLWLSKSISPMLATVVGMMALGFFLIADKREYRKARTIITVLIVLYTAISAIIYRDYIAQKWHPRPITWEKTLRATLQKPYLGWGYRSFNRVVLGSGAITAMGLREFTRPHQDWLHTACELGFPSILFIGGFFIGLWRKFKAKQNKDRITYLLATSILIGLVIGTGQTFIRYACVAGTWLVLLAFLEVKLSEQGNR